jgi:hypothetical protein
MGEVIAMSTPEIIRAKTIKQSSVEGRRKWRLS